MPRFLAAFPCRGVRAVWLSYPRTCHWTDGVRARSLVSKKGWLRGLFSFLASLTVGSGAIRSIYGLPLGRDGMDVRCVLAFAVSDGMYVCTCAHSLTYVHTHPYDLGGWTSKLAVTGREKHILLCC